MLKRISHLIPTLGLMLLPGHDYTAPDTRATVSINTLEGLHRPRINNTVPKSFQNSIDQINKAIDEHNIEGLTKQVQNLKALREQGPQSQFFVNGTLRDHFIKVYEDFYKENIRLIQTGKTDDFKLFLDKLSELRSIDRDLFESPSNLLIVPKEFAQFDAKKLFRSSTTNAKAVLAKTLIEQALSDPLLERTLYPQLANAINDHDPHSIDETLSIFDETKRFKLDVNTTEYTALTASIHKSSKDHSPPLSEGADRILSHVYLTQREGLDQHEQKIYDSYAKGLTEVLSPKGIKLETIPFKTSYPWIEDILLIREDGKFLIANPITGLSDGLKDVGTYTPSNHYSRRIKTGGSLAYGGKVALLKNASVEQKNNLRLMNACTDFGNVLSCKNHQNQATVIIGEDSLYLTELVLNAQAHFNEIEVNNKVKEMDQAGAFSDVNKLRDAVTTLIRSSRINPYLDYDKKLDEAKKYLARIELTKKVFADDFGLDEDRIVFIKQAGFHIDMEMRPGKAGQIFINDYSKVLECVTTVLKNPKLKQTDKDNLEEIKQATIKLVSKLGDLTDYTVKTLEEKGFTVVRVPGVFHNSLSAEGPYNFMNGIMGMTPEGSSLYMTNQPEYSEIGLTVTKIFCKNGIDEVRHIGDPYQNIRAIRRLGALDCWTVEK